MKNGKIDSHCGTRLDSTCFDAKQGERLVEAGRLMKYFVYVLRSITYSKSYVGSTDDLERRLKEHNSGRNYFTKRYAPWEIFYFEEFNEIKEARKREKYLKSASGRKLVLKKLFV